MLKQSSNAQLSRPHETSYFTPEQIDTLKGVICPGITDSELDLVGEHLEVVTSLERHVAELEADLSALQHAHEQLRNERWWATYNAALTGLHAWGDSDRFWDSDEAHAARGGSEP